MQLDLAIVKTKGALMEWIQENFGLPEYFEKNWDAVEECLRDYCLSDVEIEIVNEGKMADDMEEELETLRAIIDDFNASEDVQIILL